MFFPNREAAGRALCPLLLKEAGPDAVVLGLPRGGVAVAAPVARALHAPLDVRVVKKIGAPGQPELALGAVTANGITAWNQALLDWLHLSPPDREALRLRAQDAAQTRERLIRRAHPPIALKGKVAVVVDDGIATGMTAEAIVKSLHAEQVRRIVLAVPVIAPCAARRLSPRVDTLVSLDTPKDFYAVGAYYQDFPQIEDETVLHLLQENRQAHVSPTR